MPRMAEGIDHEEATPCEHHQFPPPRDGERFAAVSEGQHLEPDARLFVREPVVIEAKKDGTELGREKLAAGHVAGLKKACGHW